MFHHPVESGQYTSIKFTDRLDPECIPPSIGTVGDAYDNALMECMIGLFKTEAIRTTTDVKWTTVGWVDW